jgi:hypothetical protein
MSVTTLISFHRENAKKNGNITGITVQMPDSEILKGIIFTKIYPTCTVFYFSPRTF